MSNGKAQYLPVLFSDLPEHVRSHVPWANEEGLNRQVVLLDADWSDTDNIRTAYRSVIQRLERLVVKRWARIEASFSDAKPDTALRELGYSLLGITADFHRALKLLGGMPATCPAGGVEEAQAWFEQANGHLDTALRSVVRYMPDTYLVRDSFRIMLYYMPVETWVEKVAFPTLPK